MKGLLLLLLAAPARASEYGVLLLAHGGSAQWNETVEGVRASLDRQAPCETALGMADAGSIQKALDRLDRRGVSRVVALPLFVHSSSEVLDQTRYVLGLRPQPSQVLKDALASLPAAAQAAMGAGHHHHHGAGAERVRTRLPVVMTAALDDDALVAEVLSRRAAALSRAPQRETVILIGHGPVDDEANGRWLATMRRQAGRVRRSGRFKAAVALTIRDDSRPQIKGPAIAALRAAVGAAARDGGRALVVPYLIARGGIEDHLVSALSGLDYAWDGKTLCPDPAIEKWAAKTAAQAGRIKGDRK